MLEAEEDNINNLQDTLLQTSRPFASVSGLTTYHSCWTFTLGYTECQKMTFEYTTHHINRHSRCDSDTFVLKHRCHHSTHTNVSKQTGSTDCALFAMAYLTHLALGEVPTTVTFCQAELRLQLIKL